MPTEEDRKRLLECAALIRRGWCRDSQAKDAQGNACEPWEERAAAWCALGAIYKVTNRHPQDIYQLHHALRNVVQGEITSWNDSRRDAEEVARAFEGAAVTA